MMTDRGHNPQLDQMMAEVVATRDRLIEQRTSGLVHIGGDKTIDQAIADAESNIRQIEMMMRQSKIDRANT